MVTRRQALKFVSATGASALLSGCAQGNERHATQGGVADTRRLRVLATSDMHGMFVPWLDNEYDEPHTGVRNLAQKCPEFDLIVASHQHKLVEGEEINGVLVVENQYHAQTMAVVDLTLERDGGGRKVTARSSTPVKATDYEPDLETVELMASYDERAKRYAREVIGTLEGGPLAPKGEFEAIPQAVLTDTALIDLINEVQLYHSGAKVSSTALSSVKANIEPGPICRYDVSRIYKHQNTLYTLEMTGAQLKRYLEWSADFYKTFRKGDLSPAFDSEVPLYNYDMFQGVSYTIEVSKEPGARIRDLSWPDGAPVRDDEAFSFVTSNYRTTSNIVVPGTIYEQGDMPKLQESDVHGNLGGIRAMIADFIQNVRGGKISPECDGNWSVVGFDWDEGCTSAPLSWSRMARLS